MTKVEQDTALELAKQLAYEAGKIMRMYYRSGKGNPRLKEDNSVLTIADNEVNDLVIREVQKNFPEHGVLGEEASWHPERDMLWVCDPIDGTSSYVLHMPIFTFALSLVIDGVPEVALAYNPMTNELFFAQRGRGAYLDDQRLQVSQRGWNDRARLMRQASAIQRNLLDNPELALELHHQGLHLVTTHGAVWSGVLIADGSADGYIYEGNSAHDIATLKLLVEEAGGLVTDLAGDDQLYNQAINGAVVSNGKVHDQLLGLIAERKYAHTRH